MHIKVVSPAQVSEELNLLISQVEQQQGAAPFGEVLLTSMRSAHGEGIGVEARQAAELVAYAFALPNPDGQAWTLEVADSRSDLAGHYDRFVSSVLQALAGEQVPEVVLWVHSPVVPVGLAGLQEERRLFRMRVSLPIRGQASLPAGFSVRGFQVGRDEAAWLAVNNRAFAGHPEQGNWSMSDLEKRMGLPWFDAQGLRMLWAGDTLAGFHWTKLADTAEKLGEVYVLAVDQAFRGRGLARAITWEGLDYLAERGATTAQLYVDAENAAAVGLYGNLGFERVGVERAFRWVGDPAPAG